MPARAQYIPANTFNGWHRNRRSGRGDDDKRRNYAPLQARESTAVSATTRRWNVDRGACLGGAALVRQLCNCPLGLLPGAYVE